MGLLTGILRRNILSWLEEGLSSVHTHMRP